MVVFVFEEAFSRSTGHRSLPLAKRHCSDSSSVLRSANGHLRTALEKIAKLTVDLVRFHGPVERLALSVAEVFTKRAGALRGPCHDQSPRAVQTGIPLCSVEPPGFLRPGAPTAVRNEKIKKETVLQFYRPYDSRGCSRRPLLAASTAHPATFDGKEEENFLGYRRRPARVQALTSRTETSSPLALVLRREQWALGRVPVLYPHGKKRSPPNRPPPKS